MDAMTEATAVDETGGPPPEFGEKVINQLFDLWVLPELRRRGLPEDRISVRKAAVLLRKDQQPEVLLNEDFVMATKARMTRDVEAGEPITTADIADIEWLVPEELDPDAAWLAYLTLPDGRAFLQFNFLYERGQARDVITSAAQFLKSADRAAADGNDGSATENAFAAAELSVMALMRVHVATGDERDKDGARRRWLVGRSTATRRRVTLGRCCGCRAYDRSPGTARPAPSRRTARWRSWSKSPATWSPPPSA